MATTQPPSTADIQHEAQEFLAFLATTNRGRTANELTTAMQDLVEAIRETGKTGTLTYKLTITPSTKSNVDGTVTVKDQITVKAPALDRPESTFFIDEDCNLVRNHTRLDNGDIQLAYHEETTAKAGKGNIEMPRDFTLLLTPWVGCHPVEVDARLRYQIDGGQLAIGYQLVRPDLVKRDVFDSLVERIRDGLTTEAVFDGTAPAALR